MMHKPISNMTEAELDTALPADLASALVARLRHTKSVLWAELDFVNDRVPGYACEAKEAIADGLAGIALGFRTASLPHWKPAQG